LIRRTTDGLTTYHFKSFEKQPVVHAVFTRLGGASQGPFATLNVGRSVGDDLATVAGNLVRIYGALGVGPEHVATAHQVHSNRVQPVGAEDGGQVVAKSDGLITNTPGLALLLRFADCQPILLYDPVHHALGLVHAGWRGVAQGMARRAVEAMQAAYGTRPADLKAGLGPAIGACCYRVGDEVASAMGYSLPDWQKAMQPDPSGEGWRLDLSAANAQQLVAAGVRARSIERAGLCTSCHSDEFFSHRAHNGTTGRFAAAAYLLPREGATEAPVEVEAGSEAEPEPARDEGAAAGIDPPGLPGFGEVLGNK
jgi:hypothetical protein